MPAFDAARTAWVALRGAMRSWGVASSDDLSAWLAQQGFPRAAVGTHFSRRAQERILRRACTHDARCSGLEAAYVHATLFLCRCDAAARSGAAGGLHGGTTRGGAAGGVATARLQSDATQSGVVQVAHGADGGTAGGCATARLHSGATQRGVVQVVHGAEGNALPPRMWRQFDDLDLEELFKRSVPTVRDPPRWFRGGLQQAFGVALREWNRHPSPAAWKLFLLVPRMLLAPTEEKGSAGKKVFQDGLRRFMRGNG